MLEALRFVQGSIDKKGVVEELLHYQIKDGFIRGYNGRISLCSPIEADLDITPKGDMFMKAIASCEEVVALSVTDSGRVSIKSGDFRAYVPQSENPFPEVKPEGMKIALPDINYNQLLKELLSFTAVDASRPWANGVLFVGDKAYATNNITVVEFDMGAAFPSIVNVPKATIKEMLRIKDNPTHVQIAERTITFHYPGDRWLCSNLISCDWPNVPEMLSSKNYDIEPVPDNLFDVLVKLKPFADDMSRVFLDTRSARTHDEASEGAVIESTLFSSELLPSVFNIDQLLALQPIITHIDLNQYPSACPFYGEGVRGVIIGMRF